MIASHCRLQRLERINIAVSTKMATLCPLNIGNQFRLRAGSWFGLRFEVGRKQRGTLLIDNLADRHVCERNGRETSADPFDQNRGADIANSFSVARSYGAHDVSDHATVNWPPVNGRKVGAGLSVSAFFPYVGMKRLARQIRCGRQSTEKFAVGRSDEHSVNPRIREKLRCDPLLCRVLRIGRGKKTLHIRKGLVIGDDAGSAGQVVIDQVTDELNEGLAVA